MNAKTRTLNPTSTWTLDINETEELQGPPIDTERENENRYQPKSNDANAQAKKALNWL